MKTVNVEVPLVLFVLIIIISILGVILNIDTYLGKTVTTVWNKTIIEMPPTNKPFIGIWFTYEGKVIIVPVERINGMYFDYNDKKTVIFERPPVMWTILPKVEY